METIFAEYSPVLSQRGACRVHLKLENYQLTGSFKVRGAMNRLLVTSADERRRGVIAASTGNHGAAVAYAGRQLGIKVRIVVPEGAAVIDTRSPESYRAWHWRGAEHRDYSELMTDYEHLSRDVTYVLYCELGLKSARLAELMQRSGYEAYSVLGGVKGLRRLASSEDPITPVTSGPVGGADND